MLMHRMMFEDFKRVMPDAEIHFACPSYYHDAVKDHPFIDKLIDSNIMNKYQYLVYYNTTSACGRTEMKNAPFSSPHRSDIWAEHCGVILTQHNMHINLTDEEKNEGRRLIESGRDRPGPSVVICPVSAMQNKNLLEHQLVGLVNGLKDRGLCPMVTNNNPVKMCFQNDIPMIIERNIRKWMAILNQADYVISVDTASFHCAGGMGKPLVGIFSFVNGDTYSKYYDKVEVLQGPCRAGYSGCYNYGCCPIKTESPLVPCITEVTPEMILAAVDNMLAKWPTENYNKGV